MEPDDRETTKRLYEHYRRQRDGIRNRAEMVSICLICGSVHVVPKSGDPGMLVCRDCGFAFYRYACVVCGEIIDSRDPKNPACRECGWRICTCGTCCCRADYDMSSK